MLSPHAAWTSVILQSPCLNISMTWGGAGALGRIVSDVCSSLSGNPSQLGHVWVELLYLRVLYAGQGKFSYHREQLRFPKDLNQGLLLCLHVFIFPESHLPSTRFLRLPEGMTVFPQSGTLCPLTLPGGHGA